jgi:hypothetical protein
MLLFLEQIDISLKHSRSRILRRIQMSAEQSESAGEGPERPRPAGQVERWPIERLIKYANDARLHGEADLDKIAASTGK